MNDPVTDEKLLAHEADGIKELDNNLPRWWLYLFYATILFAPLYLLFYHVTGWGDSSREKYEKAVAAAEASQAEAPVDETAAAEPDLFAEPSTNETVLARGKEIFMVNCIACHTATGGGLVGPNLCDNYFIHGPEYGDTVRIVQNGVMEKGMIAWKTVLPPEDIQAVCSYVRTLLGTNPPNPKAPEGTEYPL